MKLFAGIVNLVIVVACYIALFYSIYQASSYMDANNVAMATRYGVLSVFFAVYIVWIDLAMKLKKIEEKLDAKSNGG